MAAQTTSTEPQPAFVFVGGRPSLNLVATVGKLDVRPNAGNVIPGSVGMSLDVRHVDDNTRRSTVDGLLEQANAISTRRGLKLEWTKKMDEPSVPMDERLTAFMTDAMEGVGFTSKAMASGAGHDAMIVARRIPAAILFLRSPGGLSHHPDEAVVPGDVEAALATGVEFLNRLRDDRAKLERVSVRNVRSTPEDIHA